jgi:hypothetical protein
MNKPHPDPLGSLDPLDSSETSDSPVFPEGSLHPDSADDIPADTLPADEQARGAQGRFGISEEPPENAEPIPRTPKTVDQQARDRDRDRAVRETGEDLG